MNEPPGAPAHAPSSDFDRVGKSSMILAFGRVLILILSIVVAGLLTRLLGDVRYGAFAVAMAFATISISTSALISMAAARYGIHHWARGEAGKAVDVFRKSLRLATYASLVLTGVLAVLSFFLQSRTLLLFSIPFVVFSVYKDVLINVFYVLYKLHLYVLEGVLFQLFMIPCISILIPALGVEGGFIALDIASGLNLLVVYILARRLFFRKHPPEAAEVGPREMLKYSTPYYFSGLISSIQVRGGVLILAYFASQIGLKEAGYFNLAVSLMTYGSMIFFSLPDAVAPMLGKFQSQANREKFQATVDEMLKFSLVFAVPVVFGLFSIADPVMALLFGSQFRPAGLTLAILGVGFISHSLRKVFIGVLLANFVTRYTALAEAASLVLFGALAWPLTSRYGSAGTSAAFVGASFLSAALYIRKSQRLGTVFPWRRFLGIVAPGAVFLAAVAVPGPAILRVALIVGLLPVYLGILKMQGHFDFKDLRSILRVLQRTG